MGKEDFLIDNDYKIITDKVATSKDMYIILDALDINYNDIHVENSINAMKVVLNAFKSFCVTNKIDCGNLYIVEFDDLYYAVCDGLFGEFSSDDCNDYSIEFDEFSTKHNLNLDDRSFD